MIDKAWSDFLTFKQIDCSVYQNIRNSIFNIHMLFVDDDDKSLYTRLILHD